MANVFDVAKYILNQNGETTAMKLQKLCYYSQAWALAWGKKPLFNENIEAWANGPVIPALYEEHKGRYTIKSIAKGRITNLSPSQKETIDKVISFYGKYNPQQLSDLTHLEDPWKLARNGLRDGERGNNVISLASLEEYYSTIQ